MSAILEANSSVLVKPLDDCSPGQHLDGNLMRDSEPEPSKVTLRNYEIINVYYFKLLNLR